MKFELKHRLDETIIPFDMTNGEITSDTPLPVPKKDIISQYHHGLICGCTCMFIGDWKFEM